MIKLVIGILYLLGKANTNCELIVGMEYFGSFFVDKAFDHETWFLDPCLDMGFLLTD